VRLLCFSPKKCFRDLQENYKSIGYTLKIVGTRLMGAIYGKNANANYQVIEVVLTV
jgi:hypothetical protein